MVVLRRLFDMEDALKMEDTALPNGDVYTGYSMGVIPHGKGTYTWLDGTIYEGDWEEGKMTGKGKILWPSGAKYEGDISGGYLHGFGTFIGPNGSEYLGTWRMNIQHGLGKKKYPNSDIYEGSWKEGVQEGSGKYSWNNGNIYIGSWKGGTMSGRGVMKWINGDIFDGVWLNGLRHGSGVYRFADGGYYFGSWSKGLKDGKGTFYPAGTKHPPLRRCSSCFDFDSGGRGSLSQCSSEEHMNANPKVIRSHSEKISVGGLIRNSGHTSHKPLSLDGNSSCDAAGEFSSHESSFRMSLAPDDSENEKQDNSMVVYEREYMQGVLIKERVRSSEVSRKIKQRNKFHVKKAKKKCVDIFEGNHSDYLMLNLQLGIRYTVGKITPVPMRDVRASDFGDRARIRMYFPRNGSQFTPPHYAVDFYWKDYCPMVFRNLREMFKLDAAEYMMSICGDDGLRELSSPGKSGSIFYLSLDDRFVIKTLKKSELKTLLKMLPKYYHHVGQHDNTLITKFFGLHRITLRGGRKVRFVVMGNMFCTELKIHRRYDLKGSSHGRYTDKEKIGDNTTLKDLDLTYEFHMDKLLRESLFKQLFLDCKFLESQQIIDYSLLLGLHFRAPEQLKALLEPPGLLVNYQSPAGGNGASEGEPLIPPKGLLLVTHEPSVVSTAPGVHIRGNTLRAYSVGAKEVDLLLPGTARLRVQLGVNMPAQASRKLLQDEIDSAEIELFEMYDVVLYMGIIDILQEYNVKKKFEHACKSLKLDPHAISVADPEFYAKRFINFLYKVFPEQP
ncbi:hypothetical protein K2173_021111 [Erythroxylum novogranatense]|uniref:Phosphatidylinositol 4-phosphate 5-kinase n=1 Tax=Erythroxylum novogranatense TaxID=1862640 RepID=A0AAV8TMN7_9ROSI|nr:hypothetical protein K2173_021111 [Erythroxylum novogranatense]